MSPARQDPESEPTTRHAYPRTRYRRQPKATESETPLSHLRRRYANSAAATLIGYLAVIATTVVRPSALTLKQVISLEFGLGILAALLTLVTVVLWVLTENTSIVLSVFKAASAASAANAALESELSGAAGARTSPIPIQRGQEIRQRHGHRHAG
jgi:hypothetical protein